MPARRKALYCCVKGSGVVVVVAVVELTARLTVVAKALRGESSGGSVFLYAARRLSTLYRWRGYMRRGGAHLARHQRVAKEGAQFFNVLRDGGRCDDAVGLEHLVVACYNFDMESADRSKQVSLALASEETGVRGGGVIMLAPGLCGLAVEAQYASLRLCKTRSRPPQNLAPHQTRFL